MSSKSLCDEGLHPEEDKVPHHKGEEVPQHTMTWQLDYEGVGRGFD